MKIIRQIDEMIGQSAEFRSRGLTVGLVPTMGALHQGHLSLLSMAKQRCDRAVMSIFVNPTQFAPGEDFEKYPRPFESDCEMARGGGCDVLFIPSPETMFHPLHAAFVTVDRMAKILCGASRPGHFRGVATVVLKLFNIVSPHVAVFGQKDAQQVVVLKRMVDDLNCPVRIIVGPIVREEDGLAMSSRNRYLTEAERRQASLIHRGLSQALRLYHGGERSAFRLRDAMNDVYCQATLFAPEYVEIVNCTTLEPVTETGECTLVAVAVRTRQTKTRLIDNIMLGGDL